LAARWFARSTISATAFSRASSIFGLPSVTPRALAAAKASVVRLLMSARYFCAIAANKCTIKGSTSGPRSATKNGTRRTIISRKMSTLACRIVEKQLDGGIRAACIGGECRHHRRSGRRSEGGV
jgi:hypothetical protein